MGGTPQGGGVGTNTIVGGLSAANQGLGGGALAGIGALGGIISSVAGIVGAFAAKERADVRGDLILKIAANQRRQQARAMMTLKGHAIVASAAGGADVNRGSTAANINQNVYEAVREMAWDQQLARYRAEGIELDAEAAVFASFLEGGTTIISSLAAFGDLPEPTKLGVTGRGAQSIAGDPNQKGIF